MTDMVIGLVVHIHSTTTLAGGSKRGLGGFKFEDLTFVNPRRYVGSWLVVV